MKYYLINLHYIVPMAQVEEHTVAHRAYLRTQYDAGILLFSGPRVPRTGGVLFGRAENIGVIETMIAADPFKTTGTAEYEIVEVALTTWVPEMDGVFKA